MTLEEGDKKRRKKAWITSIGVQAILLLICYLIVAWREPYPPNPEFGIELSFGETNVGQGSEPVQRPQTSQPEQKEVESDSEVESDAEIPTEAETTEVEPEVSETYDDPEAVVTQNETETAPPPASEEETEPVEEEDMLDERAIWRNPSQGNEGDEGYQGDPNSDSESTAYGEPGGGGDGPELRLTGWQWDRPPVVEDESDQVGIVKFKIKVDADGYIKDVIPIDVTMDLNIVNKYKAEVWRLTFSRTSSDPPGETSEGYVTFKVIAR